MPNDPQLNNDGFDGGVEPRPPLNQLDKNQKIAAASLAVFAVLIVVLWSVQLKNSIYGPLNGNTPATAEQSQIDSQTVSDLALKNKDTDSDGLSDYDELNLYKTSPYIADSDSDGIKDGEEIKKGTDPNCPAGRTCASSESSGNNTNVPASSTDTLNNLSNQGAALNSLLNQMNAANPAAGASAAQPAAGSLPAQAGASGDLTAEQKQALQGIDAASLRELLLQAGMAKETLDQISDTELMQSYSETLQ